LPSTCLPSRSRTTRPSVRVTAAPVSAIHPGSI
jgi:hypothetical protein